MGQVLQGGAGQAPARQATVGAGLPVELPSDTINKVCASSIRAVEIADSDDPRRRRRRSSSRAGWSRCRTRRTSLKKARFGYRLGDGTLIDLMTHDGLTSSFDGKHMVEQASFVSRELGISREEQDRWALRSHERAVKAIDEGRFEPEIVPVGDFAVDESPRRDTSLEKLASAEAGLRPGGHDDGRQRAGRQRRRVARSSSRARSSPSGAGSRCSRRSSRRATSPTSSPTSRARPAKAGAIALEKAGQDDRRRRAGRAERGLLLGRGQLDEDARRRPREGERQRRRGRARPSDRRLAAGASSATMIHELRRNGGGLGLAAICSGGGQGDALLLEV